MKYILSYLAIAFLWLLHWLPLPALRAIGWGLGRLLFGLARARREVALTNLRLCFPEMSEVERHDLARQRRARVHRPHNAHPQIIGIGFLHDWLASRPAAKMNHIQARLGIPRDSTNPKQSANFIQ